MAPDLTITPAEIRAIREGLGLSEAEFADALRLGNRNKIIREYQSGARAPAPPTIRAMRLLESIVYAYRAMVVGRTEDARTMLAAAMGLHVRNVVDRQIRMPVMREAAPEAVRRR